MLEEYQPRGSTYMPETDRATSTQCYKHFTGPNLQVCKYRAIIKITFSPKYCQIKCGNDPQLKILYYKVKTNVIILKSELLVATCDFKNRHVFTDL